MSFLYENLKAINSTRQLMTELDKYSTSTLMSLIHSYGIQSSTYDLPDFELRSMIVSHLKYWGNLKD